MFKIILYCKRLPLAYTSQVAYSTIGSLASSTGAFGPSNINFWAGHTPLPQARNASFGVQQSLGRRRAIPTLVGEGLLTFFELIAWGARSRIGTAGGYDFCARQETD